MGYSTIIDLLSSTLIGGFLLLLLFKLNDATVENNYVYGGEAIAQSNLVEVVQRWLFANILAWVLLGFGFGFGFRI